MNLNTVYMAYDYQKTNQNIMADSYVQDELTRLRLKLVEQKIRGQSSYGMGASYYSSPSSSNAGIQQLLQAETLKSEQLLQRVKEERRHHQTRRSYNQDDDHSKEMMSMVMSQNMQLQQMMLQQMISSSATNRSHAAENRIDHHSLSTTRQVEIEQIGHREMTPFSNLQRDTKREPAAPIPAVKQSVAVQRKPSPKPLVPRGTASPVRPTERLSEPQKRSHTSVKPQGFIGQVARGNPEHPYPFPGTKRVRKLRHFGYVAWACFILLSLLKKVEQRRLDAMDHLNSLINDAIDKLHRKHYLDLDSPIYATIQDAVKEDSLDLKVKNPGVFQRLSRDAQAALSELSSMIETIVYNVTQIKPPTGLLSATREGVLWELTQVGVLLPQDYLWQVEKDNMTFSERGELVQVTNQVSTILLLGLFISRSLVSTLLLKPTECGLIDSEPSNLAASNLKVLASVLMRIVRDVLLWQKKKTMPLASEVSPELFSDEDMKYIYKKLDDTLIWSRANLKRWAEAYIDSVSRS